DPVADTDPLLHQGGGQAPYPGHEFRIGHLGRTVIGVGDQRLVPEHGFGPFDDAFQEKRFVHHRAGEHDVLRARPRCVHSAVPDLSHAFTAVRSVLIFTSSGACLSINISESVVTPASARSFIRSAMRSTVPMSDVRSISSNGTAARAPALSPARYRSWISRASSGKPIRTAMSL